MSHVDAPLFAWFAVVAVILVLLALDLLVFHRNPHEVSTKEAALSSAAWVAISLVFGGVIWVAFGPTAGGEYLAGYVIEKSLSVDNIFVFALVFSAFAVPSRLQHRVLFWGVIGALVCRAIFIGVGTTLVERLHWILYVFGAFLIITGFRMARARGHAPSDLSKSRALRAFGRIMPVTDEYHGGRFAIRQAGKWVATPLLAALVVVEASDILFAVDSIPAIFGVTTDPFLVFTSNAFAVLGLRALYFLLAGMLDRFVHLKLGLAGILVFVGVKLVIAEWVHIPIVVSLGVIGVILAVSIVASLRVPATEAEPAAPLRSAP